MQNPLLKPLDPRFPMQGWIAIEKTMAKQLTQTQSTIESIWNKQSNLTLRGLRCSLGPGGVLTFMIFSVT